ncbi:MAG: septum formation protein Maf [Bdellovibrionales bacterium]|nr:septum formation protein Maf [Bdellovibrionales bacterium]
MTQRAVGPELILASTSRYRKKQLESWRIPFKSFPPKIDESKVKIDLSHLDPSSLCLELAKLKAQSIAQDHPHSLIIGSDQMALLDGQVLDKPGSADKAKRQLTLLSGKSHSLLTSLFVCYQDRSITFLEEVKVVFKNLSNQDIEDYLSWDQAWDCAGSYKYEHLGICLIQSVEGRDPSSILGLPLMALSEAIEKLTGLKPFTLFSPMDRGGPLV